MTKQELFFETLGPIVQNEYLSRNKWVLPSVCLAQAALESGYNLKAKTLFGIKAKAGQASTVLTTTEYYNNNKVVIDAAFASYPDIASAVVGYYDLVTKVSYYKDMVNNPDYKTAIYGINNNGDRNDMDGLAMYATDPNYEQKIINIIETYKLTKWDKRDKVAAVPQDVNPEVKRVYTVQSGDTLNKIAAKFNTTVDIIAKVNGIKNVNLIRAGQKLVIVSGYEVKVTSSGLNVRYGPGVAHGVKMTVKCGELLIITEERNGWGKTPDNGWVNLSYTTQI